MSYVRNAWYVSTWVHDVTPERPVGVRILNEPIVLWRDSAGALSAFEDRCIHRLAPLSMGRCEGARLRCMYHGIAYDRMGRVVEIPGQEQIAADLRVRTYPVVERHGAVWVWMGEPRAMDEKLIPPVVGLDNADYVLGHGQLDIAASANLINDNLLDLSHVPFLHAGTAQLSEEWARERPKFTKRERSVHTEWWVRGEKLRLGQPGDTYRRSDFFIPGVLIVTDRIFPVGQADSLKGEEPDLAHPPFYILNHLVSPMTDRSTRYFYCVGSHCSFGEEATQARDALMILAAKAFAEDKKMIEAQQEIMDLTPNWRVTPTRNDRGVILLSQVIQKLSREKSDPTL